MSINNESFENIKDKTDEELVKISLINQEYFAWLIKRYESRLYRYILRISNFRHEEIEDVLQDVFIKVYQNLNDFDQSLKFSSWIYRITHNQVVSHFRKYKAHLNSSNTLDDEVIKKLVSSLDIEKEIDHQLLKENINRILNLMDIKYREVLILKYLEQKDYNEISDIIQKPLGTVATLINRAKKKFKEELSKQKIILY